jgi:hypothetical protein
MLLLKAGGLLRFIYTATQITANLSSPIYVLSNLINAKVRKLLDDTQSSPQCYCSRSERCAVLLCVCIKLVDNNDRPALPQVATAMVQEPLSLCLHRSLSD